MKRGDTINIAVMNKIGLNSLFYHQTEKLGIKDFDRRFEGHQFGNVYQRFYWSMKVPRGE